LAKIDGIERVRVSYLQPAEIRPSLLDAMAETAGVVPYYDISFQHASAPLLRRMRRFGSRASFLELLNRIRDRHPEAGIRTNVILGFPGETESDVEELEAFLGEARLDVVGVFGYSDEEGTEAERLDDKVGEDLIGARVDRISSLLEELTARRAQERMDERVELLIEEVDEGAVVGRTAFQGPDVDGSTTLLLESGAPTPPLGQLVPATIVGSEGVDLLARPR
jgi:tRNA A37 methylthiotransferase MiaB